MAGLFGLFGGKKKEEDPQPKDAFFLDDESAKSMGDTAYMKESKNIRRTYPAGAAGTGHFEVIKTVSAVKSSANDSRTDLAPKRVETPTPTYQPATSFTPASSFGRPDTGFTPATSFGRPEVQTDSAPAPQAPAPAVSPSVSNEAVQKRRQADDGMDMFRNMAKKVGK